MEENRPLLLEHSLRVGHCIKICLETISVSLKRLMIKDEFIFQRPKDRTFFVFIWKADGKILVHQWIRLQTENV